MIKIIEYIPIYVLILAGFVFLFKNKENFNNPNINSKYVYKDGYRYRVHYKTTTVVPIVARGR